MFSERKARIFGGEDAVQRLMLLQGVCARCRASLRLARWPDLSQAGEAKKILLKYDEDQKSGWQEEDVAQQRKFLIARARALDAYASGDLAKPYEKQRPAMARAAVNLWRQVIADGQDRAATAEGANRIAELQKLVAATKSEEESP